MTILAVALARRLRLITVVTGLLAAVVVGACGSPAQRPAQAPTSAPAPMQTPGGLVPGPTPAVVGPESAVDTAQLLAATPSCRAHPCRLLARANGFGDSGAVVALLAWDRTDSADPNYEMIMMSAAGEILWHSPDQRQGHANGYERFTPDGHNRLFLPLAAEPRGQIMIILEWRAGKIDDRASLTTRRFYGDSVVYAEDRDKDGTAEIVTQSSQGIADADTGGLLESVYTLISDDYKLTGCRQREGETFQWTARDPAGGRCTTT